MTPPECINLEEQFGNDWHVKREEGRAPCTLDPWTFIIPCRCGDIYPYSDTLLAACLYGKHTSPAKATFCKRQPWVVEVVQDGDMGELTVLFHPKDFREVAIYLGARKRRHLSEKERAAAIKAGARTRFQKGRVPHGATSQR